MSLEETHRAAPQDQDASDAGNTALAKRPASLEELPSSGLLSFYDRLRQRILKAIEKRGGKLGPKVVEALLVVPDLFMFMLRLCLDKEVPSGTRALLASALTYFILPVDFLPELVLGPTGFLDDVVLALIVLAHAFGPDLEPYAEKYWSGPKKLHHVLRDTIQSAHSLIGHDVLDGLRGFLAKRGIDIDQVIGGVEDKPTP